MNTLIAILTFLTTTPARLDNPWTAPLSHCEDPAVQKKLQDRPGFWEQTKDEKLIKHIQTAKIKAIGFNIGGSTISLRLDFTDGSSAAFKPDQFHEETVPRYEIAAYHINKLLGMSRVPPSSWRVITKKELVNKLKGVTFSQRRRILREVKFYKDGTVKGEVSHWVPVINYLHLESMTWRSKWMSWLAPYDQLFRDQFLMAAQISNMILFDFIINNPDRFTGSNTLSTPDKSHLYYMDNTFSFYPNDQGSGMARIYMSQVRRFSKKMIDNLKKLTKAAIKKEIAKVKNPPWTILTEKELNSVIKRRDYLMEHIVKTVAHHGWSKSVVFP
ncbi:hypothetical protein KKF84_21745 [Myxococcota bacterium]|nr:hypothetical protein [Myxococcota bacterium]MBU1537951.1 hypothetical protein [Myxococcota bacterium]